MKTLGERIREQRKKRAWSQADLAKRVGVTQAAISEIERDVPKSSGLVIPIARAFKIDVADLVGDKAIYKPVREEMDLLEVPGLRPTQATGGGYVIIPKYDVVGSCGHGVDVNEVNIIDGIPMSSAFLRAAGLPTSGALAVVQASGNSMAPTIEHGETLMVNTHDTEPKSTKIYLVCIDGRLFIKRLIYTPTGWIMRSDNADKSLYPDFTIEPERVDFAEIQGRIVWKSGVL